MLTVFNRCCLVAVDSNEALYRIRRCLAEAGIPCKVKVEEQFCNSHNRGGGIAVLAGERYRYIIYIRKQDRERAEACITGKETI